MRPDVPLSSRLAATASASGFAPTPTTVHSTSRIHRYRLARTARCPHLRADGGGECARPYRRHQSGRGGGQLHRHNRLYHAVSLESSLSSSTADPLLPEQTRPAPPRPISQAARHSLSAPTLAHSLPYSTSTRSLPPASLGQRRSCQRRRSSPDSRLEGGWEGQCLPGRLLLLSRATTITKRFLHRWRLPPISPRWPSARPARVSLSAMRTATFIFGLRKRMPSSAGSKAKLSYRIPSSHPSESTGARIRKDLSLSPCDKLRRR